jgi:hypothetical protein
VNQLVVKSILSELCDEFAKLKIVTNMEVVEMEVGSSLLQEIWKGELEYEKILEIKCNIKELNHLVLRKMMKECYGTKEGSVCLTSKN